MTKATRLAGSGAVVLASLALAGPALASPAPDFEAPFACRQSWYASTRDGHSPSWYAIDFSRADDYRSPVVASAPGVVTTVADLGDSSYGKYVVVDHGGGWTTLFAHLDAQWVVPGERVDQGDYLGLLGTTGNSTGPHLHFEERLDGADQSAMFHGEPLSYNTWLASHNCGDVPVVGDWNGDARTDLGVFRRSAAPKFRLRQPNGTATDVAWSGGLSVPVTGDWNGDHRTDLGAWSPRTRTFTLRDAQGSTSTVKFGRHKDKPVTGDWDGDGRTDLGVFRPRKATFRLRFPDGSVTRFRFGTAGSIPVTGDWNADGRTDVGTYNPATSSWALRRAAGTKTVTFGTPGSLPVVGDWNGNGTDDLGVWAPRSATFTLGLGRQLHRVQEIRWGHRR